MNHAPPPNPHRGLDAPPPPPIHQQAPPSQQYPPGNVPPNGVNNPPGNPQQQAAAAGDSYFTETRKGEVNELRTLLRAFDTERNPKRKREVIKKVIAYMTLGIDVSRLFSEMMLQVETRDLVIKKMVYLFLCNYATSHPELAQMCTNTLQKDCGNEDPMVRGLALRALCSLRLPEMVEYISEPLRRSLSDPHAYVRKTGVMGCLKLFHLNREFAESCSLIDTLYDMLKDSDSSVVQNCIYVLNEMMRDSDYGGMRINRAIMLHLLNRLHEFSEFGVLSVLELVPKYRVADSDEAYGIMNLLDPLLRTNNSGVALAIIRCFFALTEQAGDDALSMQRQVVERIKVPLITLVAGGSSEIVFCLLKHIDVLSQRFSGVFDDEYRQFYVRYNEPTHIKYLKVRILHKVANATNAPDIVGELSEYIGDIDTHLSRLAIQSMARIACSNASGEWGAEHVVGKLVELLDLNVPHASAEAANALKDVLRKNPSLREHVAPPLPRALKYTTDPRGKSSIIWLLGEVSDISKEAPYVLEKVIDSYDTIKNPSIKMALLSSTMKIFFNRPPEVQAMLGRLLRYATDDVSTQDVHDRALYYYRLLRASPQVAEQVIKNANATISTSSNFIEQDNTEMHAALMNEFNSLSIIYGCTSDNFIDKENIFTKVMMADEPISSDSLLSDNTTSPSRYEPTTFSAPQEQDAYNENTDNTGLGDLLGFGDNSPTPAPTLPASESGGLSLDYNATMTGDAFQKLWGEVSLSTLDSSFTLKILPNTFDIEGALASVGINTMASGELPSELKFFLYAREIQTTSTILLLVIVSKSNPAQFSYVIKTNVVDASKKCDVLIAKIKSALSAFL